MVVYVDLIFLLNLLIDAAVLQATAWSRRLSPPWWRLWLAAALGASYVVMMFFPEWSALYTFVIKCMFSLIMTAVAFGLRSLQFFLGNVAVFYLVNFAAAGCMFGLHYVMQSSSEVMNGMLFTQSGGTAFQVEVSTVFIVLAIVPSIYFYRKVWSAMRQRDTITQYKAEVEVRIEEEIVRCTGLIDTGNQLYDPLTRTPVIVMQISCWKSYFNEHWVSLIERSDTDAIMKGLDDEEVPWRYRLRFVPYQGIQKGTNFMLALKPDEVVITQGERTFRAEKVLVGLKGGHLSTEGAYQAILHPGLLEDGSRSSKQTVAATDSPRAVTGSSSP